MSELLVPRNYWNKYQQTAGTRPWLDGPALKRAFIPGFQGQAVAETRLVFGCDWKPSWHQAMRMRRLPHVGEVP